MTVVDRLRSAFPGSTDPGDDAEPTDGSTPDTIETAEPAPWWRAAVVGLVTGLASLLVVLAPVVLAWLTDPIDGSTLWQAVGTGAAFWLLSSGAHLSVGPIALSLVPLLALALLVIVARRGAREALAEVTTEGEHWHGLLPAPLAIALGAWWGGYAVAVAAAVGLSIPGAFSVSALSLALPLVLVPLLSAALAVRPLVRDEPDVLGPVLNPDRVPDLVRRGIRPGMAGVRALFAVAAVVVLSAVALSWGEVSTISAEVGAAGVGSVVLALAQLAYLPNIAVWVISFLAGPGFQVVEGGAVTWSSQPGPNPGPSRGSWPSACSSSWAWARSSGGVRCARSPGCHGCAPRPRWRCRPARSRRWSWSPSTSSPAVRPGSSACRPWVHPT